MDAPCEVCDLAWGRRCPRGYDYPDEGDCPDRVYSGAEGSECDPICPE